MKVLIGYDGSKCSNDAILGLGDAGLPDTTLAHVLSVGEVWLPPPLNYGLVDTDFVNGHGLIYGAARDLAAAGGELLSSTCPSWKITTDACVGNPALCILDVAAEVEPDLIVLGSHGRTGLARFLLGSVSHKTASEAPCSVRIGRHCEHVVDDMRRIVIGVDGSEAASAAVRSVRQRHWPTPTSVKLVTAIDPRQRYGMRLRDELERVHELHAPLLLKLWDAGFEASSSIFQSDPRELLIREAERFGADTIFVGATEHFTLESVLSGSVVAVVAARAHCSVEVIRSSGATIEGSRNGLRERGNSMS